MNRIPSLFKISWPELFLSSKCYFSRSVSPGAQQVAGPESALVCCVEVPACAWRGRKGSATGAVPSRGAAEYMARSRGHGSPVSPGSETGFRMEWFSPDPWSRIGVWE